MRLWTLHPKYLDPQGLVALWREALLARAVLRGRTLGYRSHPQLDRFWEHSATCSAINAYLAAVHAEATNRGYTFDRAKIGPVREVAAIVTTTGQLDYEWRHLTRKLRSRNPRFLRTLATGKRLRPHPLFRVVSGPVQRWERVSEG
jgi:Pyrimidine dimer DNA glycosylase